MIDWPHVALNALWITGCATILAALSYASWVAYENSVPTRQLLRMPGLQLPFAIGMDLISLGLLFLSRSWLERLLWAFCVIFFAWRSWELWRISQR